MYCNVDINDVEEFITSDTFTQFLMSKTTNFGTAAFILQTLLDKVAEIKEGEE